MKISLKELLRPYLKEDKTFDRLQNTIFSHYLQPHRKYHNLSHIYTLLSMADSYKVKLDDFFCVCLAIWFHDIVYDPKKNNNEEKSVELALLHLGSLKVGGSVLDKVSTMIFATKTHQTLDNDCKLLVDFDLAILGAPIKCYTRYAAAVRKEYAWLPNALYRKGRKKILLNFLDRSYIYASKTIRARLETRARENIQNEIDQMAPTT